MKYKRINKWLNALESGEYNQTRGKLTNSKGDAFCCLGVLTNEYCEAKNFEFDDVTGFKKAYDYKLEELESCSWSHDEPMSWKKKEAKEDAGYVFETTTIKDYVQNWIGLRHEVDVAELRFDSKTAEAYDKNSNYYSGDVFRGKRAATDVLASLNDGGAKFVDIARFIRMNKKVLFK